MSKNARFYLLIALVFAGAMGRLIPHPSNFTAVAAIGLFAGYYFRSLKEATLVVIASMFISDLFLGLHSLMWVVYAAMALPVLVGWMVRGSEKSVTTVAGAGLSSISFFVVTNFAVWVDGGLYPQTLTGLSACFVAAIPFFQNQLLGDLFFGGVLFGALHVLQRTFPALSEEKALA